MNVNSGTASRRAQPRHDERATGTGREATTHE